jgi:hypothetical protein
MGLLDLVVLFIYLFILNYLEWTNSPICKDMVLTHYLCILFITALAFIGLQLLLAKTISWATTFACKLFHVLHT